MSMKHFSGITSVVGVLLLAGAASLYPAAANPSSPGNATPLTIRPNPQSGLKQFQPLAGQNGCNITAPSMNFGTYNIFSTTALTSTMTFTVTCGQGYQGGYVLVTFSTGSSGTYTNRTMTYGPDTLDYNLYSSATHTTVVGDCTGATTCYWGYFPRHGGSGYATVYGQLPAQQNVSPGTYTDVITITLNF